MRALWWWVDRWRQSSAFLEFNLEEQGAYRNLLDVATLRGGALPNDDRVLAKACGDATKWKKFRAKILRRFHLQSDGWHHETLDKILEQSARRAAKQARFRGNATGNGAGNATGNGARPLDQDLSIYPPIVPPKGGRARKRKRHDVPGGTSCPHTPRCRSTTACVAKALQWDES